MASPLPPNATGTDAATIVFAGCENRVQLATALAATKLANQLVAGGVGVLIGLGIVALIVRARRKGKSP